MPKSLCYKDLGVLKECISEYIKQMTKPQRLKTLKNISFRRDELNEELKDELKKSSALL